MAFDQSQEKESQRSLVGRNIQGRAVCASARSLRTREEQARERGKEKGWLDASRRIYPFSF